MPRPKTERQPGTDLIVVRDRERTPQRIASQNVFLEAYSKCGNIKMAAREAKIDRRYHAYWMHTDPEYGTRFRQARELAISDMVDEAHRRAVHGYKVPVYQKGMKVGEINTYSDNLLMFLLKGAAPETYRDKWWGDPRAAAVRRNPNLAKLTDQELEILNAIAARISGPAGDPRGIEGPDSEPDPPIFQ